MGTTSSSSAQPVGPSNQMYAYAKGRSIQQDLTEIVISTTESDIVSATMYKFSSLSVTPSIAIVNDQGELIHSGIFSRKTLNGEPSAEGRKMYMISSIVHDMVQVLGVDVTNHTVLLATEPVSYYSRQTQSGEFQAGLELQNGFLVGNGICNVLCDSEAVTCTFTQPANIVMNLGTKLVQFSFLVIAIGTVLQSLPDGTITNGLLILTPSFADTTYSVGDEWSMEATTVSPTAVVFAYVQ